MNINLFCIWNIHWHLLAIVIMITNFQIEIHLRSRWRVKKRLNIFFVCALFVYLNNMYTYLYLINKAVPFGIKVKISRFLTWYFLFMVFRPLLPLVHFKQNLNFGRPKSRRHTLKAFQIWFLCLIPRVFKQIWKLYRPTACTSCKTQNLTLPVIYFHN